MSDSQEKIDFICDSCNRTFIDTEVIRFENCTFCSKECLTSFHEELNKKKVVEVPQEFVKESAVTTEEPVVYSSGVAIVAEDPVEQHIANQLNAMIEPGVQNDVRKAMDDMIDSGLSTQLKMSPNITEQFGKLFDKAKENDKADLEYIINSGSDIVDAFRRMTEKTSICKKCGQEFSGIFDICAGCTAEKDPGLINLFGSGTPSNVSVSPASVLTIEIPGKPVTKMRPRFARKGKFVRTFDPQSEQKDGVRWFIKSRIGDMEPLTGPIEIEVIFYFKQPFKRANKMLKYHTKKPDADNLAKWVMDVGNGLLWLDDRQVVKLTAIKGYDTEPRTVIVVSKL